MVVSWAGGIHGMLLDACAAAINFYIGKAWDQLGWPVTSVDKKNTRFGCTGLILHGPFTPAPRSVHSSTTVGQRPQGFEAEGVAASRDVLCLCRGEPAVGLLAWNIFKQWTINGTLFIQTPHFTVAYASAIQNESPRVFFKKCHVICSSVSVESSSRLDVAVIHRAS